MGKDKIKIWESGNPIGEVIILLIGAYCLIHLQARKDSHKVTDQPKDVRSASTPTTHVTQDLEYCHFSHG